ncbi:TAFII28-domain-containing protein [Suillus clintonianus]|uniref:TAFII28-domain-containing protein n=1 Tax=Suillus clintonianus TaxID=1904413 RepID=UPI001B85D948|nr:TAFII28-domain-containing protein [Suillus clintonianus]KAG2152800.1 TAFII28-domain-containing protein [Suillus clintonianus]
MTTPYTPTSFIQMTPSTPATPSPAPAPTRGRGTGAKRGRKPRGTFPNVSTDTPRPSPQSGPSTPAMRFTPVQWATPGAPAGATATASTSTATVPAPSTPGNTGDVSMDSGDDEPVATQPPPVTAASSSTDTIIPQPGTTAKPAGAPDEDAEGEDELLPAMADDDYSAQLSWQSESKDNLKVLMDNFSPGQYERFEAYRRHALPKQAIRKVIQQTTGQQVSQPVAQIVAGVGKVFVGEIVEKARQVQSRRNDSGPLTPDHLREAYRMYQAETGRVGSARPMRGKRLFVK